MSPSSVPIVSFQGAVFLYWLLAGLVSMAFFERVAWEPQAKTRFPNFESVLLQRIFYFVAGGALLPMAGLMLIAAVPASLFAARVEAKRKESVKPGEGATS